MKQSIHHQITLILILKLINDLDINCRLETYHIISSWCGEGPGWLIQSSDYINISAELEINSSWCGEGPGWLIQSSDSNYINISAEQEVHMCHYLKN